MRWVPRPPAASQASAAGSAQPRTGFLALDFSALCTVTGVSPASSAAASSASPPRVCRPCPLSRWYSIRSAWVATPSARAVVPTRWTRHCASVGSVSSSVLRNGALGQVVDAPPAGPPHADRPAGVEQPLGGDLHLRPVPPGPARLGPAELGRGQRALVAQPTENLGAGLLADLVPALALRRDRAPPPGVVRPVLDRQDARGVRPVLEGRRLRRGPVRRLDRVPPDRPEPRVRDQLVRPREHGDRVKLHRPDPPQHPRHAAAPGGGAKKPLRVEGEPPVLVAAKLKVAPG